MKGKTMINETDLDAFGYFETLPKGYHEDMKLMAMTPLDMVTEFATSMGQPMGAPFVEDSPLDIMRYKLLREELEEVSDADGKENLLKELADLVYVTYGYAATFGWDLDEALRRVHTSNMSKLGLDGKPEFREDGKVLKGPNYNKPTLGDLV